MGSYVIRKVVTKDADTFFGEYKGHTIEIWRDEEPLDHSQFTIMVTKKNCGMFATAYDGDWGCSDNTMDEAIEEALLGAMLIDENQRRFQAPRYNGW